MPARLVAGSVRWRTGGEAAISGSLVKNRIGTVGAGNCLYGHIVIITIIKTTSAVTKYA